MKLVEFLKKYPPYNKGETAGFTPERAEALEKAKIVKITGNVKAKKKSSAQTAEVDALRAQLEAKDGELKAAQAKLADQNAAQTGGAAE